MYNTRVVKMSISSESSNETPRKIVKEYLEFNDNPNMIESFKAWYSKDNNETINDNDVVYNIIDFCDDYIQTLSINDLQLNEIKKFFNYERFILACEENDEYVIFKMERYKIDGIIEFNKIVAFDMMQDVFSTEINGGKYVTVTSNYDYVIFKRQ